MDALIEIGKNTAKYFLWMVVGLALFLLLIVLCCIALAINCAPLALLVIFFYAAAAISIMKYHIERHMNDEW